MTNPNPWFDTLPGPRLKKIIEEHGDKLLERYHTIDVHFAVWMHAMNKAVQRRVPMSYDDFEDWDYRTAYDEGMFPARAAIQMLDDNGYGDEYFGSE